MVLQLEDVKTKFSGKLIGSARMQTLVCETLLIFPEEIIEEITRTCWFVASYEDAFGFTLRGDELGGKHLIFLSDDLLEESSFQQHYTVAHEMGHVILKHRNAILEPQSKLEVAKQEQEADSFAKHYLE